MKKQAGKRIKRLSICGFLRRLKIRMATRIIIALNALVFLLITIAGYQNPLLVSQIYATYGLVPSQVIYEGAIWQIVTAMFIHSQSFLLHILFNMLALWSLGRFIEEKIGTPTFLWLYFLSGLSSGILIVAVPWLLNWTEMLGRSTIGASGAVLGLLGALYVLTPNARMLIFFFPMKVRNAVILIAAMSVILTYLDYNSVISHLGHLGGLVGGILYTRMIVQKYLEEAKSRKMPVPVMPLQSADADSTEHTSSSSSESSKSFIDSAGSASSVNPPPPSGPSESSSSSSSSASSSGADQSEPESSGKILVFDAKTGKFYYK